MDTPVKHIPQANIAVPGTSDRPAYLMDKPPAAVTEADNSRRRPGSAAGNARRV